MNYINQALNRDCPPIPDQQEIAHRAQTYLDAGWTLFCCTTYVGLNDSPEEYVEPHWLIATVEAQGWRLDRLDYLCVDIDRVPSVIFNGQVRPRCRVEAKLMFRRNQPTTETTAAP